MYVCNQRLTTVTCPGLEGSILWEQAAAWTVATVEVTGCGYRVGGCGRRWMTGSSGLRSGRTWSSCLAPAGRYVVVGDRDLTAVARPASGICAAGVEVGGEPDR